MKEKKTSLFPVLFFPLLFVAVIWLVKIIEINAGVDFIRFGIYPRKIEGLIGILFYPLIHGSINHLINNSASLLILGVGIFHFYKPIAFKICFLTYFMSGLWIWLSAREAYHIGASGLIYGFASFIFISGILRKNSKLLALSLLVIFLYGSMVWGIFPIRPGISWEGHLWGAIAGIILAFYYRNIGPQRKKYSWELEEEEASLYFHAGDGTMPPGRRGEYGEDAKDLSGVPDDDSSYTKEGNENTGNPSQEEIPRTIRYIYKSKEDNKKKGD